MSALGPELVPEGVTLAEALPTLMALCAFSAALGIIQFVDAFVKAVFWGIEKGVSWIPIGGKLVVKPVHKVEQRVTQVLGSAVNTLDGYIAHSWHQLGVLTRQLGREIEGLAETAWLLANRAATFVDHTVLRFTVKALLARLRHAIQLAKLAYALLRPEIRALRHMVVEGVWPRIHGVEHGLDRVIEHDIATLRARTYALERKLNAEYRWLRTRPWNIATKAFVGAVAIALVRLGIGWLRCRNVRRVGRRLCGLSAGLLDDLLGLTFAFGVLADPEEIARLALDLEEPIEKLVRKILV